MKDNSPEIKKIISENAHLFWYTPDDQKEDISHEFLVETILNYGNLDDIRQLINVMGIKEVSSVFFKLEGRKKLNYYPEIYNFFSLLFKKYA
ncbi:MAG: hypothetical protein K9J13_04235 [Saprospiraceae bacterium]|nr:hypothetical protein [Saprospiraceae bacterium]